MNEQHGFGPGFVSPSLTGSEAAAAAGHIEVAALLRAQEAMQRDREMAASQGRTGSGFMRSSAEASSQSSSSDPQEASMAFQQHQIDPRLLASISFGNPYLQFQQSMGATLPGAPSMDDYQSALFRAASSTFFRDFPHRDVNASAASFYAAGLPPNMAGFAQDPFSGFPVVPTPAQALPTHVPDASHYASLRGGSTNQRSEIAIPSQERGRRPEGTHPAMTGVTRGILEPFPERLHRLLIEVEAAGHSDIISFTEDGQAFKIHKPEEFFRKIVQVYFKQTRLSSFKRQLNLYGFELIDHGEAKGGYYHELFMRDEPNLARQIRRVDNRFANRGSDQSGEKRNRYTSSAPDFYSMPPILSSDEAKKKLTESRSSEEEGKMDTGSSSSASSSNKKSESSSNRKRKSSDDDERDAAKKSSSE